MHRPSDLDPKFTPVSPAEPSASQRRKQNPPSIPARLSVQKKGKRNFGSSADSAVSGSSAHKVPAPACLPASGPSGLYWNAPFSGTSSAVTSKTPHVLPPWTPLIPLHCFNCPFSTCYYAICCENLWPMHLFHCLIPPPPPPHSPHGRVLVNG